MRLVVLGPPGAGKGTQASRLAEHLGAPHVATGDMFRQEVESGSPLGQRVREIMERGELVPDPITNEVLRERIAKPDAAAGFILDGYPRNVDQAAALDAALEAAGWRLDAVVRFMVTGQEIVSRLSGRRVCPVCNAVYHVKTNPPRIFGVCDNEGASLVQREDDLEETILRRLEVYGHQTKPLLDLYGKRGLLVDVDAIGSTDEVFERILEGLKRLAGSASE